ncbi:tyrosine-protein phosphatase 2 [Stemphylium lycopersici]|nr:tyrosine-protein phosphatase 2 [Stemphylium lycopersici]
MTLSHALTAVAHGGEWSIAAKRRGPIQRGEGEGSEVEVLFTSEGAFAIRAITTKPITSVFGAPRPASSRLLSPSSLQAFLFLHSLGPHRSPDTNANFFKLHKLRALRRKAKLKGVLTRTDPNMADVDDPISPSSSKRSRSKDSVRSVTTSSLNTPAASTPAASTNSLLLPGTPATGDPNSQDAVPYPAFLKSIKDIHGKWQRLEVAQMERFRDAAQASNPDEPGMWARCCGEDYALRNRYANVDPYQSNRVHLEVPEGHWDYINASPITLKTTKSATPLKYIATQGPKADSWSHIWRMIWKENASPAVIVMLTQTYEAYREKCFPYYPQSPSQPDMRINEHDEFEDGLIHNLHLASYTIDEEARTQVREVDMTMDDGSESKKIWHLLFAGWPDFSVPEGDDRAGMLKLVDISRQKNSDNATNPRIVHCSAGIGRSGTFIALDWLMQELEEGSLDDTPESEDPVEKVVQMLRDQRAGMVQSKIQFQFIYDVMRERWRERWIAQHPDEASQLGLVSAPTTYDSEQPALKRQKSVHDSEAHLSPQPASSPLSSHDAAGSPDARAQLEAELQDADMEYEKGKT